MKIVCPAVILFCSALVLSAGSRHPDPDLFDGTPRHQQSMPDAGAIDSSAEGGEDSQPSTENGEDSVASGDAEAAADASAAGDDAVEAEEEAEAAGTGDAVAEARSFEGLDEIGGVPVDHPGADPVEEARETESAGVAGTPERTTDGDGSDDASGAGAATEERSFDDLRVGGSGAEERSVEVNRSIELRPVVEPRPTPPERGAQSSPQRDREAAEAGSDIPSGI